MPAVQEIYLEVSGSPPRRLLIRTHLSSVATPLPSTRFRPTWMLTTISSLPPARRDLLLISARMNTQEISLSYLRLRHRLNPETPIPTAASTASITSSGCKITTNRQREQGP